MFLCERLVGRGRKTNLTLTEGEKYTKCACVIPMPTRKSDMYACERDCTISFMYHYLAIMDVHRLNISQYLLRIVAKGTISIQRSKDWTLTYHIFCI